MRRAMTTVEELCELIRAHYEASTHRGDAEAIRRQLAPDFVDHDMPPGTPPGPEPVIRSIQAFRDAVPDIRIQIHDIVAQGDRVAVRASWSGTQAKEFLGVAPTGRRFEIQGMVFWRIQDGRIAERWASVDRLGLLQQLGALTGA